MLNESSAWKSPEEKRSSLELRCKDGKKGRTAQLLNCNREPQ